MVWLLGERVPVADHIAEVVGVVAQHVVDLARSVRLVLTALDPRLGRLRNRGWHPSQTIWT